MKHLNKVGWSIIGVLLGYAVGQFAVAVVLWLENRESRKRAAKLYVMPTRRTRANLMGRTKDGYFMTGKDGRLHRVQG